MAVTHAPTFLEGDASVVAPRLLGCILERELDGQVVRVRIVETEAYDQTDIASHSYRGRTPRNDVMFGQAGHLYVYFTYGMHYCCNITVGEEGYGAAVLIRAVEPIQGIDLLRAHRLGHDGPDLCNGPAKLCQALMIDTTMNGHDLALSPLRLISVNPLPSPRITQTTRVGISRGQSVPWRFYETGNPYVSRI